MFVATRRGAADAPQIAFLIVAHTEPLMLRRLVLSLAAPWVRFFIHIDAKVEISPFAAALADIANVEILRRRVAVYWGGWSQVEASLGLMRAALASHRAPMRFALLSGACYPLRSNEALREFLFADDTEHIMAYPMPNPQKDKPMTRLTRWHFEGGLRATGVKARAARLLNEVCRAGPPRDLQKGLGGLSPYAGSSWWVLTRDAVDWVFEIMAQRPGLVSFYRHTYCPDESFFQTILANGPARSRIGSSLTFNDWSPGPERPHPIGEAHLARLLDPGGDGGRFFFARKFSAHNAHLLDPIEEAREAQALPRATGTVG